MDDQAPADNWVLVAELPLDRDCSTFSEWLRAQAMPHQFVERRGKLVLYVVEPHALIVQQALTDYLSDTALKARVDEQVASSRPSAASLRWHLWGRPTQAPVIVVVICLSVLVALFTSLGEGGPLLRMLVFADPFQVVDDSLPDRLRAIGFILSDGQWWRLFTPALIHFNIMHILFNLLWLWYFGAKIELRKGGVFISLLIVGIAGVSNTVQYLWTGPLFGGMSGVVYGLLGFCWLVDVRHQRSVYAVPDALFGFMMAWLALGFFNVTEYLGIGAMANGAHLAGLLSGFVVAMLYPRVMK